MQNDFVKVSLTDPGFRPKTLNFKSYDAAIEALRDSQYTDAMVQDAANRVIALWTRNPGNPWSYRTLGVRS